MIPGINPRQMAQAMKRMGIQQQEIDAKLVIIELDDKKILIKNPQVSKVNMMGQISYQITGEEIEESAERGVEISEEDIQTVMEQAGVDKETALSAIQKHEGDLAGAIMELQDSE